MIINHNIAALNTHRQMGSAQSAQMGSMEKLSSGLRINSAKDDAAGLSISEKMRGQIRGLDQASRNSQDAISMIQTAEGALSVTSDILQRMRELAVQSSNDTTTDADRSNIQTEINQLSDEINRIGNSTEFNTKKLINGNVSTNIAEGAKVTGGDLGSSVTLINGATNGKATGSAITSAVNIHGDTAGFATGSKDLTGGAIVITAGDNEISFSVDGGAQQNIALTENTYTNDAAGRNSFLADVNSQLSGKGATASLDANNQLVFTSTTQGANSKVNIQGGNAVGTVFGAQADIVSSNGTVANDVVTFDLDGVSKSITLSKQVYNTPTDLMNELNAGGTSGAIAGVTFSLDGNALVATSSATSGSTSKVSNFNGTAVADLKLVNATTVDGQDQNNQFEITIGEGASAVTRTATVAAGNYTDMDVYAVAVKNAINTALGADGSVNVTNSNGNLTIEDAAKGSDSKITITDNSGATADLKAGAKALGFVNTTATNTTDAGVDGTDRALKMQIGANKGQELSFAINDMRSQALGLTSSSKDLAGITDVNGESMDVLYAEGSKVSNEGADEFVINVSSFEGAKNAISVIDNAISKVSSERSNLGAVQNRLEHTINNVNTSAENLTAAESRIRDVDYAEAA